MNYENRGASNTGSQQANGAFNGKSSRKNQAKSRKNHAGGNQPAEHS